MKRKLFISFSSAGLVTLLSFALFSGARASLPVWMALTAMFLMCFMIVLAVLSVSCRSAAPAVRSGEDGERDYSPPQKKPVMSRGYEVYSRSVRLMEEKQLYLDADLNLDSFSRDVFSNKVYVSKNINYYAGCNFRQFVNRYRINYALELMRDNPRMRMEEVAIMSGFRSSVPFNMAFRLFVGKTPTEWLESGVGPVPYDNLAEKKAGTGLDVSRWSPPEKDGKVKTK